MSKQSDIVKVSQGASGDPLFIDTANDRVGIGTTSPTTALDVVGAVTARGDGNSVAIYAGSGTALRQEGAAGGAWYFDVGTGGATHGDFIFRSSSSYAERMRIDSAGRVTMPSQPRCLVSQNGGWRTLTAGTSYGVSDGSFFFNNGGFYSGGQINGFNVVHVPMTGWYRFDMYVYYGNGATASSRWTLLKNNVDGIIFAQTPGTADATLFTSRMFYMAANDYVNYNIETGFPNFTAYHAYNHTMLAISLEG